MANEQRRNDIGGKVFIGLSLCLIGALVTFFITGSTRTEAKANINSIDIREVKTEQKNIKEVVVEMKMEQRTSFDKMDRKLDNIFKSIPGNGTPTTNLYTR